MAAPASPAGSPQSASSPDGRSTATLIAALAVRMGDADAMIAGAYGRFRTHFNHVRDVIGTRANGDVVRAPHDGYIVFPNALAEANYEWFYLAEATTRFNP